MQQYHKKWVGWPGLLIFLFLAGFIFTFMLQVTSLSVAPNYPHARAVSIISRLAIGLVSCLAIAVAFNVFLYRTYDQHWGTSLVARFRSGGKYPWQG
jgi:hypothetical protein